MQNYVDKLRLKRHQLRESFINTPFKSWDENKAFIEYQKIGQELLKIGREISQKNRNKKSRTTVL